MDPKTQKRLEDAGWAFGNAEDFLQLTDAERRLVDLRVKLGAAIRRLRAAKGITQKQLAKLLETSQARVVDIEAAVGSLEAIYRAFFVLGGEESRLEALGVPLTPAEKTERVAGRKINFQLKRETAKPKGKRKTASG